MSYPVYPDTFKRDLTVGDKQVTIEVGRFSQQVSAAVLVTCGETVVHSTVALGRKVNLGYFPLSVEFAEKLYSSGTIKGSRWVKRDGRPTDNVILKARVVDRSLRPLFPDGLTHEVQVINTVLSYDGENDPDMLGLLGSSLALSISDIPFNGPLSGLRVGFEPESGEFIFNPTNTQRETSTLDMVVAGTGETIVMVEAGAEEATEATVIEGMIRSQEVLGQLCAEYQSIVSEIGKEKKELISDEERAEAEELKALAAEVQPQFAEQLKQVVVDKAHLRQPDMATLEAEILAKLNESRDEENAVTEKQVSAVVYKLTKQAARDMILKEGTRPDGRATDEIRQIWCEVDVFPRTHGSAMFKRGATQAVTVTTLGDPSLSQHVEGIDGMKSVHYMHHYNMPPYASGEAGRFGFPKRREIGHGALAQRALEPMIPSQEEFPYTTHVVSEILSSNGSTSQASVCGSTLSLMAAGVPIKRPVAGIAMGLMSDGEQFIVLSDIQGLEDHVGDMDFKVAGTSEGITAIQMDIKLDGIPREVLEQALEQARVGRMHIMGEMLKVIDTPRTQLSEHAPKVDMVTIPGDKIGEMIGPGGKNIKGLSEKFGVEISVEEDEEAGTGSVFISAVDHDAIQGAKTYITNMFRQIDIGMEFDAVVTRVESYGFFVEYLPGREGLVHVSNASVEYVRDASDIAQVGDEVHVRVNEIKEDGKIALTTLSHEEEAESKAKAAENKRRNGNGRGGNRGGNRNGRSGGRQGGSRRFSPRRGRRE